VREHIFQNIADVENPFTELLCNMMKFPKFKEIFFEFLKINKQINYKYGTQENSYDNGRPDFYIYSKNDFIYIEIKTNISTSLTPNQPRGYLNELSSKDETNKKLFFIIPKGYKHEKELKNRIKKYKNKRITIKIFYWDIFFNLVKRKGFYKKDKIFLEYYSLLEEMFGYEDIKFTEKEKNKDNISEIGNSIERIENKIKQIYKLLKNDGTYLIEYTKDQGALGFDIKDKNKNIICWFGSWITCAVKGHAIILQNKLEKNIKIKGIYNIDIGGDTHQYLCLDKDFFNNKINVVKFSVLLLKKIKEIQNAGKNK
jgi:hypothetical protein